MENLESLKSPEIEALVNKFTPFLAEVKKRIITTLVVFVIATFLGFIFYENIIKFLIDILSLKGINLVFTSPFQFINLAISCGFATGITLSFPLLIAQILFFLKPALREKEYKTLVRLLPFSIILFVMGFLFGAYIMKWQIVIFLDKSVSIGIGNILDISRLLNTVIMTSVLMGVGFQFPVVLMLLLRTGLLKYNQLRKIRSWVYLGSFIFAILLPPDSILADILLAMPLIIMFEFSLIWDRLSRIRKS